MLKNKYVLYVGANNDTGEVDTEKLYAILAKRLPNCTIAQTVGFWKGQTEKSVTVTVIENHSVGFIRQVAGDLRVALGQEAVCVEVCRQRMFISV